MILTSRSLRLPVVAFACLVLSCGCNLLNPLIDDTSSKALVFELEGRGWNLVSAKKASGDIVIPAVISGIPVTSIEHGAFRGSAITSVVVPSSITFLDAWIFHGCKSLKTASIQASITRLPYGLFEDCPVLESVSIPEGVTEIENFAFSSCPSLARIDLGDDVVTLHSKAIYACGALESLTLPASLETMHRDAVYRCDSLVELVVLAEAPPAIVDVGLLDEAGLNGVADCGNLKKILVPIGSRDVYKQAVGWSQYSDILTTEDD